MVLKQQGRVRNQYYSTSHVDAFTVPHLAAHSVKEERRAAMLCISQDLLELMLR